MEYKRLKKDKVGIMLLLLFLFIGILNVSGIHSKDFTPLHRILTDAIADGAFPGATAVVGSKANGVLWSDAVGRYNYPSQSPPPLNNGTNPPMSLNTLFDMASCSKILGATTAAAILYEWGDLPLESKVTLYLGEAFAAQGKGDITISNLLRHDAGYPPDPTPYWYNNASFGCPNVTTESFSCTRRIYNALLNQTLMNPVGVEYVYSDLSFMTLMYVIGTVAEKQGYVQKSDLRCSSDPISQCYFEAFCRRYVFTALGMNSTGWLPQPSLWPYAAPTENDTVFLHRQIQGQVSDANAYVTGGIDGHAGVFSNAMDVARFSLSMLRSTGVINVTTIRLFTTIYNTSESSRAFGWNTNANVTPDQGWNFTCGTLSNTTYLHIGYTGTQLCIDPVREIFTVLLTNRVNPDFTNEKILVVRQKYNTAVQQIWDGEGIQGSALLF